MTQISLPSPELMAIALGLILFAAVLRWFVITGRSVRFRWQAWQGRRMLAVPQVTAMPEASDVAELKEIVEDLLVKQSWTTLGEALEILDNDCTDASDGRRLHDVAVDAALAPLHRAGGLVDLGERLRFYEAAAASGNDALVTLFARGLALALRRAEHMEGGAGVAMARQWALEIEQIVGQTHMRTAAVPSLAEAVYHAGAVLRSDLASMTRAFRVWQQTDPGNARPYVHHAGRLADLGYGARAELERHLEETARLMRDIGGPKVLLQAQLTASERRPLTQLPGLDLARLHAHLGQVASDPDGQYLVNAFAVQFMEEGDDAVAQAIVREILTHWVAPLWPDRHAFLALYWRAVGDRSKPPGDDWDRTPERAGAV